MEANPIVSIITPCYNYGRFLSETLDSLLTQTYENWECIIINDGSTDETEEVALKFKGLDNRFKYIYQKNKGLSGARNAGLLQAKGKYIQLLDADDLLEKDKLSLQVVLMEVNPKIDLVYSSMILFSSNAIKREYTSFTLFNNVNVSGKNEVIINALTDDNFFLPGCVLFKRNLYQQVGEFNESLYGLEDWNYWNRAALLGKEFYSDNRTGTRLMCRDHDSNMSKVTVKMLNARIQARLHVMLVTEELKAKNKLQVSIPFIKKILKKHQLLLLLDEYQYHFHYGKKLLGIKSFIKYSLNSGKPFYIFEKIFFKLKIVK